MVANDHTPLPHLRPRTAETHKGDYGRCLLVGGSRGMYGAIALSGRAALRSGAGLVTVATPAGCVEVVAGFEPSYMTLPLATDEHGRLRDQAREQLQNALSADCVACGPGMGRSDDATRLAVHLYQTLSQPLVVDADGLFALANSNIDLRSAAGPRVLTPHPGEFLRFLNDEVRDPQALRKIAPDWARDNQVLLVLKGHRTLVTDGKSTFENPTGNPGMATGGSGDVLTGVLTALWGQGLDPLSAARLAVYVHGLAGDLAAEAKGMVSMIASDLIEFLPAAFRQHQAAAETGTTSG